LKDPSSSSFCVLGGGGVFFVVVKVGVCVRGDIQFFSLNLVANLWEILQELIQVFQTAVAAAATYKDRRK
jgi:hypothetical protein